MDLQILLDTPPWEWPRDAAIVIRKTLIDRRAIGYDRLAAASLAGDLVVMSDNMADSLLAVVDSASEPAQLRAKAAISLGPVLELAYTDEFDDPDDVPISERTFRNIQDSLQRLYLDGSTPKEVRRRILEASVRAPEDWHRDAIGEAYATGDKEWMLTAVFSMRWVRGFDQQILAALKSADPQIHFEAVNAAGAWELDAAWSHIVELVEDNQTPKPLLLAAIEALGSIRPAQARTILIDLADSDDEEIAEAADDAMLMAEAASDEKDVDEDEWIN